VAIGECLFCGKEMPPGVTLNIRDAFNHELQAFAKTTVVNVRRREKERQLENTEQR
jgi:hypothetical protein